jgi:hypothetical protein
MAAWVQVCTHVPWRHNNSGARAQAFAGIAGYTTMGRTLSTGGEGHAVIAAQVTEDFFRIGGIGPPSAARSPSTTRLARHIPLG